MQCCRYEGLPPNFSLAANMAAGAFAGIAEHSVMYPIDLLKVCRVEDTGCEMKLTLFARPECKSSILHPQRSTLALEMR